MSRSEEETIEILKGIRSAYEEHHHLVISDEALEAATHLSSRYVTERFLPDKAIDLIDESSSRVRMYKSPAAKQAKDLFWPTAPGAPEPRPGAGGRQRRGDHASGEERETGPAENRSSACAPAGTAPTAPWSRRRISPRWSPCGRASR